MRTLIFSLLLLSFFSSCAQNRSGGPKIYTVDSSVVSEIDKKIELFKGKSNANISFAVFHNDKEVIRRNDVPALSFTSFTSNVVAVDCLNGSNDGFGFFLMIGKDTSFVNFKILSKNDSTLFKLTEQSILQPELLVNSASSKVILTHDPTFTQDEVIQGTVELESEYFYEKQINKETRLKFWIKAFFKSEPIPVNKNQYKTLVR